MDKYTVTIILTTVGFFALAAALLVPIWRFLNSEESRAEEWNREIRDMQTRTGNSVDGSPPAEAPHIPESDPDPDERH